MQEEIKFASMEVPKEVFENNGLLLNETQFVHNHTHYEVVENLGQLRYVEGATYPAKGIPTPERVYAINQTKTLIKEIITKYWYILPFLNKNKLFKTFNTITDRQLKPCHLKHVYLCPTAFGVYSIVGNLLTNLGVSEQIAERVGYNIAHLFEYDDAWRYRVQDLATECDIDAMFKNPAKELKRLIEVHCERQDIDGAPTSNTAKVRAFLAPITILMMIPWVKRAFLPTIRFIKTMEYDDADWYWVCLRSDYNFGGKTIEERIHGVAIPRLYELKQKV